MTHGIFTSTGNLVAWFDTEDEALAMLGDLVARRLRATHPAGIRPQTPADERRPGRQFAVLIRPDGYVAWVGEPADPDLPDALTSWFGPPTTA